jgi:hypothetical protein
VSLYDALMARNPDALYGLGEASGTTMFDISGNGRNGVYSGTYTLGVAGLVDGDPATCVDFIGGRGTVTSPSAWLNASALITVVARITTDSLTSTRTIARHDDDASPLSECGFGFRLNAGKVEAFTVPAGGGALTIVTDPTALTVGQEYTVAMVHDGSTLRIFKDGVQVASAAQTGRWTGSTQVLRVGSAGVGQTFDGKMQYVAIIVGEALTEAELADLHAEAISGDPPGVVPPSATWFWSGGVSDDGFTAVVKTLPGVSCKLGVEAGDLGALVTPTYGAAVVSDADGLAKISVTGLADSSPYTYGFELDGTLDEAAVGHARTLPVPGTPANFEWGHASCAYTGSTHRVFDALTAREPALFQYMGDLHYGDIWTDNRALFRAEFDTALTSARRKDLHAAVPIDYTWDDHDFGADNSNGSSASKPAVQAVYRQLVPHGPLEVADAIYHSYQIGRVYFIVTDLRSFRDNNGTAQSSSKTMMGATQKAWFKAELLAAEAAGAALIVWCSSQVYNTDGTSGINYDSDSWASFTHERAELADFIRDNGLVEKVFVVVGDAHMLAYDDGALSDFATGGGAPLRQFCAAALDQTGLTRGDNWSGGTFPGGGQFGYFTFTDDGETLNWAWEGVQVDNTSGAETLRVSASGSLAPPPAGSTVSWWDGTSLEPAAVLGWWDGAAVQPVEVLGWWDGAAIQPLV